MKINALFIILFLHFNLNAQKQMRVDTMIYNIVEHMPEFPTSGAGLFQWLNQNISYKAFEGKDCLIASMSLQFIIEKNGKISNLKAIYNCKNEEFEKDLLKAFEKMPQWKPGYQNGKVVRVKYGLRISCIKLE